VIIQAVSAGSIAGWPWAKAGDATKVAEMAAAGPCITPRLFKGGESRVAAQLGIIPENPLEDGAELLAGIGATRQGLRWSQNTGNAIKY
jgi:hypothetical protein